MEADEKQSAFTSERRAWNDRKFNNNKTNARGAKRKAAKNSVQQSCEQGHVRLRESIISGRRHGGSHAVPHRDELDVLINHFWVAKPIWPKGWAGGFNTATAKLRGGAGCSSVSLPFRC